MTVKCTESELPIIVEPSMVYCKADGRKCKHRGDAHEWCAAAYKEIKPGRDRWRAPDWCPHKFEALFPKKK